MRIKISNHPWDILDQISNQSPLAKINRMNRLRVEMQPTDKAHYLSNAILPMLSDSAKARIFDAVLDRIADFETGG